MLSKKWWCPSESWQWRNSYGLRVGKPAGTRAEGAPAGCPFTLVLQLRSGLSFQKGAPFKVGVNHGIFHVYHFWNFLIFKCTWVCSSSSSKNKNIFFNLSINSINLKMSIYLSISKMCSSLFLRGNQACARIANAKRTTQSRTQHYQQFISKERAWPLNWRVDLGNQIASLKTTVKFMIFAEE